MSVEDERVGYKTALTSSHADPARRGRTLQVAVKVLATGRKPRETLSCETISPGLQMRMETFFPYRLAIAAEAFSRQLVAVYGHCYGLSREEWRLLFLLEDAGELDSLRLAQRTSLDKVQVSRAASRLEAKGLITRAISREDRRLRHYAVTEEGCALFRRAFREVEARANEILDAMTQDDRASLVRGIEALHRAVAARPPAPEEQAAKGG